MSDEIDKKPVPENNNPTTVINQYGNRPIHAGTIESLNVEVNVYGDQEPVACDDNGQPYVPITPTRYDDATRTVFIGNETISLPIELASLSTIAPQEMPYINALCEVYAEKINQVVTPDTIDTLNPNLRRHYADQRKAYYSAESIHRSVREVFADGEKQFNILKDDAYDGISDTYIDDRHQTGYDRLMAVLDKVTNITLTKSSLVKIVGLIGNLEKKGICHILVNDEYIKSWVNIDE